MPETRRINIVHRSLSRPLTILGADLRIDYEDRDGNMARVELELATEHYRGSNLAEKVRAGFSLYARAQDAPGLRRVLDQKELTAEILSL